MITENGELEVVNLAMKLVDPRQPIQKDKRRGYP